MSILTAFLDTEETTTDEKPRVFVRIRTSCWKNREGIHFKKSMRFLQRKCVGHNFILEECQSFGAHDFLPMITNFHDVADGVYEVVINRISKDWETGMVDDWDWILDKCEEQ